MHGGGLKIFLFLFGESTPQARKSMEAEHKGSTLSTMVMVKGPSDSMDGQALSVFREHYEFV